MNWEDRQAALLPLPRAWQSRARAILILLSILVSICRGSARAEQASSGGATDANHAASVALASPSSAPSAAPFYDQQPLRRSSASHGSDAAPGPGPAPTSLELPRLAGALALVLGLIFLLRWAGRRFFAPQLGIGATRAVHLLSRSIIAPKRSVMLLRVGRRVLVVSDNGSQLAPLTEITDADEIAALVGQLQNERVDAGQKTFSSLFERLKKQEPEDEQAVAADSIPDREESTSQDTGVSAARAQINGLMEQVRLVSSQFDRT